MDCTLRELSDEDQSLRGPPLYQFVEYWYQTDQRVILNEFVSLDSTQEGVPKIAVHIERTALLIKREDTVSKLWHTLM